MKCRSHYEKSSLKPDTNILDTSSTETTMEGKGIIIDVVTVIKAVTKIRNVRALGPEEKSAKFVRWEAIGIRN